MPTIMAERMTDATFEEELVEFLEVASQEGGGGDAHEGPDGDDGGQPAPARAWPVVPAVIVAGIVAALLTALGMLTQIWANMAGTQLPGS